MLATMFKSPTWIITEDEAKSLRNAYDEIADAFEWQTITDPKTAALIHAGATVAAVYGTRCVAVLVANKAKAQHASGPVAVPSPQRPIVTPPPNGSTQQQIRSVADVARPTVVRDFVSNGVAEGTSF
jgi:hypothetical protein